MANIPDEFEWFDDPFHGPVESQYCPFNYNFQTPDSSSNFVNYCWDTQGNTPSNLHWDYNNLITGVYSPTYPVVFDTSYSTNSRCLDVTAVTSTPYETGICLEVECYGYGNASNVYGVGLAMGDRYTENSGRYDGARIMYNGQIVDCTQSDFQTKKTVPGTSPAIEIQCPEIDVLCYGAQPFDCINGHWDNDISACVCSPGYEGNDCTTQQNVIANGVTLFSGNLNDYTTFNVDTLCVKNSGTVVDGLYDKDSVNEFGGYESFAQRNGDYFLWFDTVYHQWVITRSYGLDSNGAYDTLIAYCDLNGRIDIPDIHECDFNWYLWVGSTSIFTSSMWVRNYGCTGGGGCFDIKSSVIKYDDSIGKGVKYPISKIKINDQVLSFDDVTMKMSYEKVIHTAHYLNGDLMNDILDDFRKLCYLEDCIVMTNNHLIYVFERDGIDDVKLIPSQQVKIGDIITVAVKNDVDNNTESVKRSIISIEENIVSQARNIFSESGNIIVNGVYVSSQSGNGWIEHFVYSRVLKYSYYLVDYVYPSLLNDDEMCVKIRNGIYYGILKPTTKIINDVSVWIGILYVATSVVAIKLLSRSQF